MTTRITPLVPPQPRFSKQREEDLTTLYDEGHASADTFLRTAFGGHLPRNLRMVNVPDYSLEFTNAGSDPRFYLNAAFRAFNDHWGKMGAMYFMNMPRMAIGLAVGSMLWGMLRLRGYVRVRQNPNRVHVNDFWAAVRLFDKANEKFANTVAHEGWHTMQAYDHRVSLSSAFHENRKGMRLVFPKEMSTWLKYLSSEAELGARMFTVVSNAYVQHGVMPENKYELWACLISQGMEPPQSVLDKRIKSQSCARAFKKFPTVEAYVEAYADRAAANNLNDVHEGLAPESQFKLWDQVLPWIYGDILEVMGDQLGHKRMGHTHNIQLREIFMKAAKDQTTAPKDPREKLDELSGVAAKMAVGDAQALMEKIVGGFPYKEEGLETILIPEGPMRLISVYALASHPDMDKYDAGRIIQDTSGYSPQEWRDRMLDPHRGPSRRVMGMRVGRKPKRYDTQFDIAPIPSLGF